MSYRVLTVCTGNICRSPMAEVVLRQVAEQAGMDILVDSAATTGWEVGNPIDHRAVKVLRRGGYSPQVRGAQKIMLSHIEDYDLILAMTREHYREIERLSRQVDPHKRAQIHLWRAFSTDADQREGDDLDVPDPWYGGMEDFEETLEILEDATENLLEFLDQSA